MKKFHVLTAVATVILLLVTLNVYASTISGGVPDSGLIPRDYRDGASGIHFIDLGSPISGDGWITSWSIYAQSHGPWMDNTDSRKVGLIIFRDNGSGYTVVGVSPLETIPSGALAWDKKYTFTDLGPGIHVKAGDYLGWYYPFQGSDYGPGPTNPGGVIAFAKVAGGGHNVLWHDPWGSTQNTELGVGPVPDNFFNASEPGIGRIYSINVSGSTNPKVAATGPYLLLLLD